LYSKAVKMKQHKAFIRNRFGTYKDLAKVLNLTEGTVKTAISKDSNVSWLNLLKHLSKENGKT